MKTVPLNKIFNIVYGSQLDLNKLEIDLDNGINFISRSRENLGVQTKVKKINNKIIFNKGSLTVALGGSVLSSFVQKEDFYTAQNIRVLTPRYSLTVLEKKFYCMAIEFNAYRYNACGREANKTLDDLLVPSLESIPKWVNITRVKKPSQASVLNSQISLNTRQWQYFTLNDIFDIFTGRYYYKDSFALGGTPLISAKDGNNGIKNWTDLEPLYEKGITIGKVDMATNFQTIPFCITSDVCVLEKKGLSNFSYLFVVAVLKQEAFRWNYGRQIRLQDTKATDIKLPSKTVTSKEGKIINEPDWQLMEDYIKSLPYSSNL